MHQLALVEPAKQAIGECLGQPRKRLDRQLLGADLDQQRLVEQVLALAPGAGLGSFVCLRFKAEGNHHAASLRTPGKPSFSRWAK